MMNLDWREDSTKKRTADLLVLLASHRLRPSWLGSHGYPMCPSRIFFIFFKISTQSLSFSKSAVSFSSVSLSAKRFLTAVPSVEKNNFRLT